VGRGRGPAGAEVLTLRTHKPDGTTREAGGDRRQGDRLGRQRRDSATTSSGSCSRRRARREPSRRASWATASIFSPSTPPLDRTELVLVTPRLTKLAFDRRGGAPAPRQRAGPEDTTVTTFATTSVPQLFVERAAAPATEYVPSVRASSALEFQVWTRYVAEQLFGTTRSSPALRERARLLAAGRGPSNGAPDERARLAAAVVAWVTENIEAADDLRDGATQTLARGSGNRLALILALLRELGVPARTVLARSRLVAEAAAPAPAQELDDFADALVEIELGTGRAPVYVDPRLRTPPSGTCRRNLDGARTLSLADGRLGVARSAGAADHRSVDVTIRLDEQGGGVAVATEELTGWPALEWAELVEKFGADRARLRQDFEQRWLGRAVPGRAPARPRGHAAEGRPGRRRATRPRPLLVRQSPARRERRPRDEAVADLFPLAARPPLRDRAAALDDARAGLRRPLPHDGHGRAAARRQARRAARRRGRRARRAQGRLPLRRRAAPALREAERSERGRGRGGGAEVPDRRRPRADARVDAAAHARPSPPTTRASRPTCAASTASSSRRSASACAGRGARDDRARAARRPSKARGALARLRRRRAGHGSRRAPRRLLGLWARRPRAPTASSSRGPPSREPRPRARHRHRVARGRRAGLRAPRALRAGPPRARARPGDELVG